MSILRSRSIEEVIKNRRSIRVYETKPLENPLMETIKKHMEASENPFGVQVNFKLLETTSKEEGSALGTYGVIKGTSTYIGATTNKHDFALEAVGYAMEKLILELAALGVGTCWLGGTFKKEAFKKAMHVKEDELFPAITPIGYPHHKNSLSNRMVRFIAKSDQRKPWEELFFKGDFNTGLSKEEAGVYALALEMVRLAPSASNKQPWRIIKEGDVFHFYEYQTPGYSKAFSYDIQQLDIGIAACHFELALQEAQIQGEFAHKPEQGNVHKKENTFYRFSWAKK
jgi:nitroreductase